MASLLSIIGRTINELTLKIDVDVYASDKDQDSKLNLCIQKMVDRIF